MTTLGLLHTKIDRELSSRGLHVEIVDSREGLRALEDDCRALRELCYQPSPCASHTWITAWWEAFGNRPGGVQGELFVVAVRNVDGRLVGLLPFYEQRRKGFGIRRLCLIGDLPANPDWSMTEESCLLMKTGMEPEILRAVGEALTPHLRRSRWDMVVLRVPYQGQEELAAPLMEALSSSGAINVQSLFGSTLAQLPASWAVYRKELSKSMRDNLGYYPRLLTRDGHSWEVRQIREPGAVYEAAGRVAELHRGRAESGRGVKHVSHIEGPCQVEFLQTLLARLAEEGQAFIGELWVDGKLIASQAFVEDGEQLMVYYSGYDEEWYKYSPIFVIDTIVFQEALERGVRNLNFLKSRLQWTVRWNAKWESDVQRIVIVPKRPLAQARAGALIALTGAKRVAATMPEKAELLRKKLAAKKKVLKPA